jgi:hypothetical protein
MSAMPGHQSKSTTSTWRWFLTLALAAPIIIWMIWLLG